MLRIPTTALASFTLCALLAVGCANPADDKPVAGVGEAAPAAPQADGATVYTLNANSQLTWVGSKVTGSHDGGFDGVTGTVAVSDGDPLTAAIDITIDTTSITSDSDRLTEHLKSADFFEVETYPTAEFVSTAIEAADTGYTVTGNLTLHGVTKGITFPAQIAVSGDALNATAEFVLKRTDWGINYKGKADDLIREEVVVAFDIEADAP